MAGGINQEPPNLRQSPETIDQAVEGVLRYVEKQAKDIRDEAEKTTKELRSDSKEQRNYLTFGFLVLGVMVATMVLMVGDMVNQRIGERQASYEDLRREVQTLREQSSERNDKTDAIIKGLQKYKILPQ